VTAAASSARVGGALSILYYLIRDDCFLKMKSEGGRAAARVLGSSLCTLEPKYYCYQQRARFWGGGGAGAAWWPVAAAWAHPHPPPETLTPLV